jgi:hypothetical protein
MGFRLAISPSRVRPSSSCNLAQGHASADHWHCRDGAILTNEGVRCLAAYPLAGSTNAARRLSHFLWTAEDVKEAHWPLKPPFLSSLEGYIGRLSHMHAQRHDEALLGPLLALMCSGLF